MGEQLTIEEVDSQLGGWDHLDQPLAIIAISADGQDN